MGAQKTLWEGFVVDRIYKVDCRSLLSDMLLKLLTACLLVLTKTVAAAAIKVALGSIQSSSTVANGIAVKSQACSVAIWLDRVESQHYYLFRVLAKPRRRDGFGCTRRQFFLKKNFRK